MDLSQKYGRRRRRGLTPVSCRRARMSPLSPKAPAVSDRKTAFGAVSAGAAAPAKHYSATFYPVSAEISSFTPGPMVELKETFLMKAPLMPCGLARLTAVTKALRLASKASSEKLALPTPAWIRLALAVLNS